MGRDHPITPPGGSPVAEPAGQPALGEPPAAESSEEETVDGLPVLAEVRTLERPSPAMLPAVQAAAAMATGFAAGAATIALVKRHSSRKLARAARGNPRRAVDMLPVVGTRTFLIDIHLIAKPED
jgi:hypothetical protein